MQMVFLMMFLWFAHCAQLFSGLTPYGSTNGMMLKTISHGMVAPTV
jgi:hypothetical protein